MVATVVIPVITATARTVVPVITATRDQVVTLVKTREATPVATREAIPAAVVRMAAAVAALVTGIRADMGDTRMAEYEKMDPTKYPWGPA